MRARNRDPAVLARRAARITAATVLLLAVGPAGAEARHGDDATDPAVSTSAAAVPTAPEAQEAQEAEGTWWSWALERILAGEREATPSELRVILDRDPEDAGAGPPGRGRGRGQGRDVGRERRGEQPGPSFCRSGEGHPVYGRRWCLDKGFRLGDAVWRRIDVGDVLLGRPGDRQRVEEPDLVEVLGDVILGRVLEASGLGDRADLSGRWTSSSSGEARVLQLRASERPVAELTDLDGDGRVDVVLVNDPDAGG